MVVLNIFHVLIAIAMVALVLVQRGAGATAGAAFGSGASGTVFGSRGAGTFLTKSTWVLATLFCAISLTMAVMVSRGSQAVETDLGVVTSAPQPVSLPVSDPASAVDEQGAAGEGATGEGQGADLGLEQQEDLPTLQPGEDDIGSGAAQLEQAADDLPQLDGASAESAESDLDETSTGTNSDDS